MVEIINLTKKFANKVLFKNFNYRFLDKHLYLISYYSGKGKTTLLNMISSLDTDYSGKINTDSDVFYLKLNSGLIEDLTVKENIELIKDIYGIKKCKLKYNIDQFINKKVNKLSFGEKQRVIIYLANVVKCKCVLLDEPLAYLDNLNQRKVIKDLNKLKKDKLVIIVTHSIENFKDYTLVDLDSKNKIKQTSLTIKKKEKKIDYFKWSKILIKNNFSYLAMFIFTVFIIINSFLSFKDNFNNLKVEFDNSYYKGNLLFKENKSNLNKDFYKDILLPLHEEIAYSSQGIYSLDMYQDKVFIEDKYLDNGFIFSMPIKTNYLDTNEVIISLDSYKFCTNNHYSYCNFDLIKDKYLKKNLYYVNSNKTLKFKIVDIVEGNNQIYFSELTNIEEQLKSLFSDYKETYFITIKNNKIASFNSKINNVASLLGYDFTLTNKSNEESIFYVTKAKHEYFSFSELNKENLIACNESLISCSSFSLMELKALKGIDNYKIDNPIYFNKIDTNLKDDEIIISKALASKINKSNNELITLKFLLNDHLYSKEVIIKDIQDDNKDVIYQNNDFSYYLFNNLANENYRFEYAYGDSLNYKKCNLLYNEVIKESELFFNDFIQTLNVTLIILFVLMFIIIFYLELKHNKKNYPFYRLLKNNGVNEYFKVGQMMYLFYFVVGIFILFVDYKLALIYLVICLVFYFINKIKIQVSLD